MNARWIHAVCWLAAVWAGGCGPREDLRAGREVNSAERDGLVVEIELTRREFAVGQTMPVTVTALNTTRRDLDILASTGAPVYVKVWRNIGVGWEEVKRYPQAAVMVMSPWSLEARGRRTFPLSVPVEPDWPTNEPLRVTAELNGRPEVAPGIIIRVQGSAGTEG